METVFTISGAAPYPVMGDAAAPGFETPPGAHDELCALQIRPLAVTGGVASLGGLAAAVFGIYKLGGKHVGAGLGSMAAAAGLWWIGGRMFRSAAQSFLACRSTP